MPPPETSIVPCQVIAGKDAPAGADVATMVEAISEIRTPTAGLPRRLGDEGSSGAGRGLMALYTGGSSLRISDPVYRL